MSLTFSIAFKNTSPFSKFQLTLMGWLFHSVNQKFWYSSSTNRSVRHQNPILPNWKSKTCGINFFVSLNIHYRVQKYCLFFKISNINWWDNHFILWISNPDIVVVLIGLCYVKVRSHDAVRQNATKCGLAMQQMARIMRMSMRLRQGFCMLRHENLIGKMSVS